MKLFGTRKAGKMVKSKNSNEAHNPSALLRCDSSCCISLSGYNNGDTGNTSSGDGSIYEWSIDGNITTVSNNENAGENRHDEPIQISASDLSIQNNSDPLEGLAKLCPRDAPVKSPLQSSTMRFDVTQSYEPSDAPMPDHRMNKEKRSGPVDVDQFLQCSSIQQNERIPQLTQPICRGAGDDIEKCRNNDLTEIEFCMNNLELREADIEFCYSASSGLQSYSASEDGDSLRNFGDEDIEYADNCFEHQSTDLLMNQVSKKNYTGIASWLLQGRVQNGDRRMVDVEKKLSPRRRFEYAPDRKKKTRYEHPSEHKVIKSCSYEVKCELSTQQKPKRKKSLKRHVITTLQTFLRPNNQDIVDKKNKCKLSLKKSDLNKQLSCISMIPMTGDEFTISDQARNPKFSKQKPELNRELSHFSTTPMTGDTVIEFPDKPKLKKTKEMLVETQRRQILEYYKQRRREEKKTYELENNLYNKDLKVAGLKEGGASMTPAAIAKVEASRDRQKLQNWVMGCSKLSIEEDLRGNRIKPTSLPSLRDSKKEVFSGSSINDASTALMDNTLPNPNSFIKCREVLKKIEVTSSDEFSSASTPEAVSPSFDNALCVVCNKRTRTHLAVPCMHFSYCEDCVMRLEKKDTQACKVCKEEKITFSKLRF